MNFSLPAHKYLPATSQPRVSPISGSASLLTLGLGTVGLTTSIITKFSLVSLPNITLLVVGVVVLDVLSQFARQTRIAEAIQTALYGFLYLAVTIVCGILTAYSMQRFALPLQDQFLASADRALGLNWSDYAYWVDGHVVIQTIFHLAYNTISGQILLPLVVLAFSNRVSELRAYLLAFAFAFAFAIAFAFTIIVSALLPAAGPIVFVDRETFNVLQFTGATPVDHLMRLREDIHVIHLPDLRRLELRAEEGFDLRCCRKPNEKLFGLRHVYRPNKRNRTNLSLMPHLRLREADLEVEARNVASSKQRGHRIRR